VAPRWWGHRLPRITGARAIGAGLGPMAAETSAGSACTIVARAARDARYTS
jgi:hypothetical protein